MDSHSDTVGNAAAMYAISWHIALCTRRPEDDDE